MAFLAPALASVAPYALSALSSQAPTIAKGFQAGMALGRPTFQKLFSTLQKKAASAEGRDYLLRKGAKHFGTLTEAGREGISLLNRSGLIRDSRANKLITGLESGRGRGQEIFGALSKINRRLS